MMRSLSLILVMALAIGLVNSVYVVDQNEQVVITRLGKPVDKPVSTPGLKLKVPFMDTVHRFDKRFLAWDGKVTEIPTKEKRNILVDTYARWRITDPLLFLQRLTNEVGAQARLDGILNGETRDAVARHDLAELIRSTDREPERDESLPVEEADAGLEPIEVGRDRIRAEILENAQKRVTDLGIELLDVQFKRINYVEAVRRSVYERMIAERRRIADRYRSEGQGEASRISGDKERELKRISSEAYRSAQEIVGRADAQATEIYASAYNRSSDSRDFYEFLKSMETLEGTVTKDTWLMLSTEGELFRFLDGSSGN